MEQPCFAANDKQLAHVLLTCCWRQLHGSKVPLPDGVSLEQIGTGLQMKLAMAKAALTRLPDGSKYRRILARHIAAADRPGGWIGLLARVSYLAWRLQRDSVAIATATGLTPVGVRRLLSRMCACAAALGYETYARKAWRTRKRGRNRRRKLARSRVVQRSRVA